MRVSSLILAAACLTACGPDPAQEVELLQLARFQSSYDGRVISTRGDLRRHAPPLHYWIEDSGRYRVQIVSDAELGELVGRQVEVVGRFRYSRERGRRIEAEQVQLRP